MTARASFASFPPGTVLLGKYRVVRELGAGGMGVVVHVEHLQLGTSVAMKFLLPEFAALPDASLRFLREARAATRIVQSEHIVRVLDVGTVPAEELPEGLSAGEAAPYIVMEYLEGQDLGRHLKNGRTFSLHEAIDLIVQATYALAHAHRAGVIHRDVKPANLFLTERPDGTPLVKVLDFGISKVVEEAAQENLELTKTKAVMGSALYMSLEQMRNAKGVDFRTDIYSLGVSLYELLTRSHPFTADSFSELCVKVSLDPPEPIRAHRPDISEELAAVIAKAYARHPDERYQTAGELAAALAPFAAQETQATIEAIQRFEAKVSGEVPIVRSLTPLHQRAVTVQRPPRVGRSVLIGLAIAGAGILGGLATWLITGGPFETPSPDDAGAVVASATPRPTAEPSASAVVPVVVVPAPSAEPSVTPVVTPSATPSAIPSANPSTAPRPSKCRPGELFYIDRRTGLRLPCR